MKSIVIAMAAVAGAAGAMPPPGPLPPPPDAAEARAILKALVEINSTHSHGTTAAAEAIQARLLAAGFAPGDVQLLAPADKPTKGNLIVRYHGKGKYKPILFIGHLDVVEAKPEDWSVDPFKLTEKDGYFYGRGTEDMKDGDAVLTEALIRLKRQGYVPDRDIIVAFTADEEAGGENGPQWFLKTHRDLVEAETVYNFDGGGGDWKGGQRLGYGFGTSEKIYLTFTLETTSPGGHGSLPGPDNAIYRLAQGLGRIEAYQFPARTTATTRAAFRADAALASGQKRADLLAVSRTETPDPAAAARLSRTVFYNAELRTTCVATLVSGGHAENALPQRAKATIQCRLLPGDSAESVQATLVRVLNEPKISVTMDAPPIVSPESPPTPEVTAKIAKVVHEMWPGVPITPVMSTGFSDDRQFRSAGMPSYDVGGLWSEEGENRAHGRDERIGVQAFDEDTEYTYRLMKALGSQP